MEAERFGSFVAQQRRKRGMTQATLASEPHVTDKAISRWERGVGFPDIGNIEPLADALGVSIVELMRAERTKEQTMTTDEAEDACAKVLNITKAQQERETKDVVALIASLAVLTLLAEMIASLKWNGAKLSITMNIPRYLPANLRNTDRVRHMAQDQRSDLRTGRLGRPHPARGLSPDPPRFVSSQCDDYLRGLIWAHLFPRRHA